MVQGIKLHASNAGVVVWPLGREPRPHMLCGTGKIKKKKNLNGPNFVQIHNVKGCSTFTYTVM